MSCSGKVALITGAGRGIGKRIAIGFAGRGAKVGLLSRTPAQLDLVHLEIEYAGGKSLPLPADVRCPEQIANALAIVEQEFGPIEILVHSAGVLAPIGPITTIDPGTCREALDTNVLGLLHTCQAVLPGMVARRSGKVVVIVSQGAFLRFPNFALDTATQTAAARFAECLAEEVRFDNVQINCMCAGRTYSHMTDLVLEAGPERAGHEVWEEARQVQRTGGTSLERQMKLIEFLCSEASNHISGKLIHVNDDWRKIAALNMRPELLTLRRSSLQ